MIKMILIAGAVVGLPLMVLVVLTQAAVAGSLNFAPKAMSFKGNRMDPLKGLARMVSMKALVELGKASLKVVLLFGVAIGILYVQAPKFCNCHSARLARRWQRQGACFQRFLAGYC